MAVLGSKGAEIDISFSNMRDDKALFSENSGYVLEVEKKNIAQVEKILSHSSVRYWKLGETKKDARLTIRRKKMKLADIKLSEMEDAWRNALPKVLN